MEKWCKRRCWCELTSDCSSESQHELVLLGVVVLGLSFLLLIQRRDKALQSLSSNSQEGLEFPLCTPTYTYRV